MSIAGIARYSLRAAAFAAAVCAVYALIYRLRRQRISWRRMLGVFYIAALLQITVLRSGVNWQAVLHETRPLPQLAPLGTTISLLQGGLWNLIYNIVGNLIWFVPLGMLLGQRSWKAALAAGAAISALIELCQYLLMTGTTDIDDVILNALGAWIGWRIMQIKPRCR